MGNLSDIIFALNERVVAELASGGYPALTPDQGGGVGHILFGAASVYEQTSPPRIVIEPVGSTFSAPEHYSSSREIWSEERRRQSATRSIATEAMAFVVRCWGAGTGSIVSDYEFTQALYHAVRLGIHTIMPGAYAIDESGKYTQGSNIVRNGREFVFGLTIYAPVLETLQPYDVVTRFAPAGVTTIIEDNFTIPVTGTTTNQTPQGPVEILPTGPTETGC